MILLKNTFPKAIKVSRLQYIDINTFNNTIYCTFSSFRKGQTH